MCLKGDYGAIPKHLLSEECPLPISVHLSPSIYYCPECEDLAEYWNLSLSYAPINARSIEDVDPHIWEEARLFLKCPNGCGVYMEGPFEGDEALVIVDEHKPSVCPHCGSSDIHPAIDQYLT